MTENNLTQLVGALGGWIEARPYGADQDALDRAARIVLDMRLLGVAIDDFDAPELAALDDADRKVVEEARVWAQARREESHRRQAAEARAARQRRVAAREASPSTPFSPATADRVDPSASSVDTKRPSSPSGVSERGGNGSDNVSDPRGASPGRRDSDGAAAMAPMVGDRPAGDHDQDLVDEDNFFSAEPRGRDAVDREPGALSAPNRTKQKHDGPKHRGVGDERHPNGAELRDSDDHEFFTVDELVSNTSSDTWLRPDVVFKVVVVIWAIAALGVVAVLLGLVFG